VQSRWNSIVTSSHKTWKIGRESLISMVMRRPIIEAFPSQMMRLTSCNE
jgi:hypothetical protein